MRAASVGPPMAALRVLYSFPTRIGTTGIGTTAWHQVSGLVGVGARVEVATGSVERPLPGAGIALQTMRLGRVNVPYRALGLARSLALHDARVARLLNRRSGDFDVVHAWPQGAEATLKTARRLGIPAVLERPNAHTAYAAEAVAAECRRLGIPLDPGSPHAVTPERLAREEREYAAAGHLLCPSDFVAATHRDRGVGAERLLRHQYGYDEARFSPGEPRDDRPFTFAFVGRVEPRKGLHTALRAWGDAGLAGRTRFVVCGGVEPGYDAVVEPLLAQPGVETHGHHPDPGAVMRDADVLVLPSIEEGSALVTYEARASGCVLAVSDHSGAPCRHEHDALVHGAGDAAALRTHLTRLVDEPGLLHRLRQASLAGIGELTWTAAARRLYGAYEIALGR
jgi:glycosyltransferase involved in cell wall biosynthesis